MSDRDNITLPREVVKFVLQHLEWWSDDEPQEKEAIEALRTALAAEQPTPARLHATTTGVLLGSAWLVWNTPKGANDEIMSQETADLLNRMFAENEALRRDAERYKWVLNWLWRYGLLSREKTRIDTPESYGDWWILRKPKVIDGSSLLGYGKTEDAAIDAAMGDKR